METARKTSAHLSSALTAIMVILVTFFLAGCDAQTPHTPPKQKAALDCNVYLGGVCFGDDL